MGLAWSNNLVRLHQPTSPGNSDMIYAESFPAARGNRLSPYAYQCRLAGIEGAELHDVFTRGTPCFSHGINIPSGLGKSGATVRSASGNRRSLGSYHSRPTAAGSPRRNRRRRLGLETLTARRSGSSRSIRLWSSAAPRLGLGSARTCTLPVGRSVRWGLPRSGIGRTDRRIGGGRVAELPAPVQKPAMPLQAASTTSSNSRIAQ